MKPAFRPKILLVDDNPDARLIMGRSLRAKGYDVLEASSGKDILSRAKLEWPALIILDIVLPDIRGTEVFEALRADPVTKAIPVLLMTAKPDVVQQLPGFQNSLDRRLEKTGRPEELVQTVHEMLTGTKRRGG